jgi:hypothetical protein
MAPLQKNAQKDVMIGCITTSVSATQEAEDEDTKIPSYQDPI